MLPPSTQPLVSVQLRFRSGSVDEPDGQMGVTALTAEVLFEGGTETLTSQQLRLGAGGHHRGGERGLASMDPPRRRSDRDRDAGRRGDDGNAPELDEKLNICLVS